MNIVIVEDEIKTRQGLERLITKNTAHVVVGCAKTGAEGLLLIEQLCPDLVITDIRMPEMDGIKMLRKLNEKRLSHQTIILSGYSEFSYAQQAIKLGVSEYLLKPIIVEDLQSALENIEQRIQKKKTLHGTSEFDLIRSLILHTAENEQQTLEELASVCELSGDTRIAMFLRYEKDVGKERKIQLRDRLEECQAELFGARILAVGLEQRDELVVLVWGNAPLEAAERCIEERIVTEKKLSGAVWSTTTFTGAAKLRERAEFLHGQRIWGMSFGSDVLIACPVNETTIPKPIYPTELENRMRAAVVSVDLIKIRQTADAFTAYLRSKPFHPAGINDAYVRFVTALFSLVQEIDNREFERLEYQKLLKRLMDSFTWETTLSVYAEAVDALIRWQEERADVSNLTVQKALNYIRGHYAQGITLEEIADTLSITPEYLSTLFNREMGINFSTFIKQYRISQAKRLLIGTGRKVYEIAAEVGFSDPKYFIRVFKEVTGLSPGDFRQMKK